VDHQLPAATTRDNSLPAHRDLCSSCGHDNRAVQSRQRIRPGNDEKPPARCTASHSPSPKPTSRRPMRRRLWAQGYHSIGVNRLENRATSSIEVPYEGRQSRRDDGRRTRCFPLSCGVTSIGNYAESRGRSSGRRMLTAHMSTQCRGSSHHDPDCLQGRIGSFRPSRTAPRWTHIPVVSCLTEARECRPAAAFQSTRSGARRSCQTDTVSGACRG
jgi:hypothetical protein